MKKITLLIMPIVMLALLSGCKTNKSEGENQHTQNEKTENPLFMPIKVAKETVKGLEFCFNQLSKGEYQNYNQEVEALRESVIDYMFNHSSFKDDVRNDSLEMIEMIDEMFIMAQSQEYKDKDWRSYVDTGNFNDSELEAYHKLYSLVDIAEKGNLPVRVFQDSIDAFNQSIISSPDITEENRNALLSASEVAKYTSNYWSKNHDKWKKLTHK